jgi:hypothetical protein
MGDRIGDLAAMTWQLPEDKAARIENEIDKFLLSRICDLKSVQKLHGQLSDLAQMCEFLKGFRFHLVRLLGSFEEGEGRRIIPKSLKDDLWLWKKALRTVSKGSRYRIRRVVPPSPRSRLCRTPPAV